jgi:DNA-binding MarR family transcriptional regulator
MVKQLDEKNSPDHIGIRLWRANAFWLDAFVAGMNASGHLWFTPARANLLAHVARDGSKQGDIVRRMVMSKQAAQQLIDGLALEGILERRPDPDDKRGNIIIHTAKGRAALADADRIKAELDARITAKLGQERVDILFAVLGDLGNAD